MSNSNSSSDFSDVNIVKMNQYSDNEWKSQMDKESGQVNNLISQRTNQHARSNEQPNPKQPMRPNGSERLGFSALQKCTAGIRVLVYYSSTNVVDEYLRMSKTVVRYSLKYFVRGVISNFGSQYLCRPTLKMLQGYFDSYWETRGFPGMLGDIDSMSWEWKNCPAPLAGQYSGRSSKPTVILKAVASYVLWIWHAFIGTSGSLNDINDLERSPVYDVLEESGHEVRFMVNEREYNMGYYLADSVYPSWATFVKTINAPKIHKHKLFAACQESCRKDVERAFGIFQSHFTFIKSPCLLWDKKDMGQVLMACIIMHNMILEDERDT